MNGTSVETIPIERPDNLFVRFTDWVSYFMGTPLNIAFWLILVGGWFVLGAAIPHLFTRTDILPAWFTSPSWNFPLNSMTTVIELYLCFLVAAASNRSERRLVGTAEGTAKLSEGILRLENGEIDILQDHMRLLEENTTLTREVRELQQLLEESNRRELAEHRTLLEENTNITKALEALTRELHAWAQEARPA